MKTKVGEARLLSNTDDIDHIAENLAKHSVMLKANSDTESGNTVGKLHGKCISI